MMKDIVMRYDRTDDGEDAAVRLRRVRLPLIGLPTVTLSGVRLKDKEEGPFLLLENKGKVLQENKGKIYLEDLRPAEKPEEETGTFLALVNGDRIVTTDGQRIIINE